MALRFSESLTNRIVEGLIATRDTKLAADVLAIARDAEVLGHRLQAALIRSEVSSISVLRIYSDEQGELHDPPRGTCLAEAPLGRWFDKPVEVTAHADGEARSFRIELHEQAIVQGTLALDNIYVTTGTIVRLAITLSP